MKIWILTHYYPPEFGGSALTTSQLARRLAEDGHSVTVLTGMPNYPEGIIRPPYRGRIFCSELIHGVEVKRTWVFTSPKKGALARMANQISFMLMAMIMGTFKVPGKPDVLLVESHPLFVCLSGGWLRRIRRVPLILNVSDLWPESAIAVGMLKENSLIVKIARWIEKWAYQDADYCIGMTEGVQQGILALHPYPDRVAMIRFPVDLQRFKPSMQHERALMRERLGFTEKDFVIAFPGNLSLQYDFDVMLNAAAALPEYKFIIAGGGSQLEHVTEQIAMRKLSNFTMMGILSHEEMPALWAAADVCLLALQEHPLFEGTVPAKLVEALAAGKPLVAAIRGEARALLEQTGAGIVLPLHDSAAAVDALKQLRMSEEQLASMSAAGRKYAEEYLSMDYVKSSFVRIFEQVIEGKQKVTNE